MKLTLTAIATAAVLAAGAAQAGHEFEDYAQVVEATPRYEQVNHPHKECSTETVQEYHERRSPAGAILGGLVGGVIGSQFGRGHGRLAGTGVGAITGAIVGDRIDNRDDTYVVERPVRTCRVVDDWEKRLTGYAVTYEYQGRTYHTVMPYDPGDRIPVRVSVSPRS